MNQEQLSRETCKEIGHLFPESEEVWVERQNKPQLVHRGSGYAAFLPHVTNHPSITDMRNWLWGGHIFKGVVYKLQLLKISDNKWSLGFLAGSEEWVPWSNDKIEAESEIEAYAEAVKLLREKE